MSENPTIKVQKDYETSNITAEVPGEQKIREMDPNTITDTDITTFTNNNTEIIDTGYTLSPVITVTKNETTLSKGDMKLQKITVTEDIASQQLEYGGHRVYTEYHTTVQTDNQTVKRPIMSEENKETAINNESRSLDQKRSRIPKLKFRQTVERVKRERREQKLKEQSHITPRRSSIPKLKDANLVKRQASLKHDWKPEESLKAEEKLEEEFDKIYEEIVDKPENDIDDKILAVKIDDPEKIETKFEEIIHAYDSNDDTYLTQTEKLRVSKIPWRKKDSDRSIKLGSIVDKVKGKSSTSNNSLKDGGFRVSATTITTKRFARGNSMDLNNQKVDVFETTNTQNGKDGDVIKETIITETIERIPITTEITYQRVGEEIRLNEPQSMEVDEKIENSIHVSKTVMIDDDDSKLNKQVTIRQMKSGIPVKPVRINRGISKDLNKRPVSLDDRDFVNRKVVKHEELIDGNSQTIFRERVVTEKATGIEKPPRGISRTFSRDGKSVTVSSRTKDLSIGSKIPVAESAVQENNNVTSKDTQEIEQPNEQNHAAIDIKKETLTIEDITKGSIKVGVPVYTKITHSYSKGIVQNVEMSKTIEWKPAEIKIKRYGRSQSEYKPANGNIIDEKYTEKVIKDDSIVYEKSLKEHIPTFTEVPNINIATDAEIIESSNYSKPAKVSDDVVNISPNKIDTDINEPEILAKDDTTEDVTLTAKGTEINKMSIKDKDSVQNVTILKGNVNRLISQISITTTPNKNETDINEPEILVKDVDTKPLDIGKDTLPKAGDMTLTEKDTEFNKMSLKDKGSVQNVTILKGNVNRLISQISVNDSKAGTKKEINIQDELPKKKSVLSKIAMFEGKDPAELNIKIKKCTIDNKRKFEGTNPVDKVYKPHIRNDNKFEINKIKSSTGNFGNEPIIVDQIWKVREEDVQIVQKLEEISIMPEPVDFTVSENADVVFETVSPLDYQEIQHIEPNLQEDRTSISDNTLLENIKTSQILTVEKPRILPEQIDLKEKQTELQITIPAKIDIISSNNKEDIVTYLPEQVVTTFDKNQREIEKPKVGKLDINSWKRQVEVNKKNMGTGKSIDHIQTNVNNVNMLIEKNMTINAKPVIDIPKSPTRIYTSQEVEMPAILPAIIDFTPYTLNERPTTLPGKLDSLTNESQLQVPIVLPETPLTKPEKNSYETQTSRIEIPVILPAKIAVTKDLDTLQNVNDTPEENIVRKASVAQVIPELNDINIEDNQINYPKTLDLNQIDKNYQKKTQFKQNEFPIHIEKVSAKIQVYELKANEISSNTKYDEIHSLPNKKDNTKPENTSTSPEILKPVDVDEFLDREVPSDPDLVDSETELKDTKETIMGKLKNKIYFIANRNINSKRNQNNRLPENVTADINDIESNENYDTEENNWQYQHTKYEYNDKSSELYKSYDDVGNADFESKDDLKRAKSLAELDLGDVVKGQVQRMVYRIKSVDFDKTEVNKSNKINAKEMPRKSSVLEKIALFEGKSGANFTPLRRAKLERDVENNSTNTKVLTDVSKNITEQIFLQKVEDLNTAKIRYSRTQMLSTQLNNGYQMPLIALGTALMDRRLSPHIVSCAIDLGYRAIDTAMIYGNEKYIGNGIQMKIEDGSVSRQDLFIISKLWSTYHRPDLVETACRASLEALGLEYFDLFLIHNPMSFKEGKDPVPKIASVLQFSEYDYLDAWFAMEELVRKGLVRSIGVSNFNSTQIQRILDRGRIKPVVNQVECHPYLSQERLQNFCKEHNILLQCYGVLGAKGTPAEYKAPGVTPVLDDPFVKVMASALNVSPARLLISYQLQSGRAVVVSSSSAPHLWDNLQALTFQIKQHEVDALTALNKSERIYNYKGMGDTHKNYPFREPF